MVSGIIYSVYQFRLVGDINYRMSLDFNPFVTESGNYSVFQFPFYFRYYLTRYPERNDGGLWVEAGGGPRVYRYESTTTNYSIVASAFGLRVGYNFRIFKTINLIVEPSFEFSAVVLDSELHFEHTSYLTILALNVGLGF